MEICLTKVMCIDFAMSTAMQGVMQPPCQEAQVGFTIIFLI